MKFMEEFIPLKGIILAPHTTFKIGGPAKYFFEVKTRKELIKALRWAKENKIKYFILGGGSNILFSDKGFNGLVIKLKISDYKLKDKTIIAEAGISLAQLVQISVNNSLTGLEWAVGIPGTLGGAIRGNAGAMGHSISEVIKNVIVLVNNKKNQKLKIKKISKKGCKFGYRESIFKRNPNLIILSAEIQLKKGNLKEIQKKINEYLIKRKNQPQEPSAGCVFKNVEIADLFRSRKSDKEIFKIRGQLIPVRDGKISAGWLIEQCNLKGKKIGQAKISEKHANFIVNLGKAKAKDVLTLINLIKKRVKNKFGIQLKEEIEIIK